MSGAVEELAEDHSTVVDSAALTGFADAVLQAVGVPARDAHLVADSLVTADLWGHQSHGVLRLPWYVERIRTGAMRAVTQPDVVTNGGALLVIDGHDGIGQVLAARAGETAVKHSRRHGIAAVAVRNSNHFGTAAYFTRAAALEGCVAILTTNASPAMAPWGGRVKTVGTNPWSIAAPAGVHGTVVMDVANTAVARGKVYLARQKGESIPSGWAMTAEGAATTDPVAAVAGLILPMAGHKGYAISFMMDVLSGVLTGSEFGAEVGGPYQPDRRSGAGHLFIAIDIEQLLPLAEFNARMDRLIAEVKAVPLADGFTEVCFPGEPEARSQARLSVDGVELPPQTLADLVRLGHETGVPLEVVR